MRALALVVLLSACEASDPQPGGSADAGIDTSPVDAAASCAADDVLAAPPDAACPARADDFVPGSATDNYAPCISDDGTYHTVEASVSSLARVEAFEQIAKTLGFGTSRAPTPADFIEARRLYSADEGIASRIVRREDEHYPPASKLCRDMTADELAANVDRCAGPTKLLPILAKGFADGANGVEPVKSAARIESALLLYLYLSSFKESRSCATTARDCDSMWAKYTGGEPRTSAKGLSRYVRARHVPTHEATYNGVLAVRCWRDLDNPTGPSMNPTLHTRATTQLDRGLLRGVALIVRQRVLRRACGASWEGAQILGSFLDREATARDPANAAILRAELGKTAATTDEPKLIAALDAIFPCP